MSHNLLLADGTLPATIRDAIHFVRRLKERYLWVDSLCIIQDDVENKQRQIANMSNIFSGACLTLVAACGDSCQAGLSGALPGSRKPQVKKDIQGITFATSLLGYRSAVENSY